jgi:hypothetical protein
LPPAGHICSQKTVASTSLPTHFSTCPYTSLYTTPNTSPYILLSLQDAQSKVTIIFLGLNHKRRIRKPYRTYVIRGAMKSRDISLGCGLAKAHLRQRNGSDVIIGPANPVQHTVALENRAKHIVLDIGSGKCLGIRKCLGMLLVTYGLFWSDSKSVSPD